MPINKATRREEETNVFVNKILILYIVHDNQNVLLMNHSCFK